MTRALPHSVPASAAGIVFQFDRALHHLSLGRGGSIGIETHDDVSSMSEERQVWEQDKLSFQLSGHPLTDRSKNLWNTLNIWAKKLSQTGVSPDPVELWLVTNRPVPSCLIKKISDAGDESQALECVRLMRQVSSEQRDLQVLIDSVLSKSDSFLAAMLRRISLFDGGMATDPATLPAATVQNLGCPNWVSPETVCQALMGWLRDVTMACWSDHKPAWITQEAFNQRKIELFVELREQRYRERPENEVLLTPEQRAAARIRRFVQHLSSVDAEPDELAEAVDDFLRFDTEYSRLLMAGEVTPKQWDGFFINLRRRWGTILRRHERNPGTRTPEEVGHDVLSDTCDNVYLAPLAGTPTHQPYLTCGGYHSLADVDRVWWHPKNGEAGESEVA